MTIVAQPKTPASTTQHPKRVFVRWIRALVFVAFALAALFFYLNPDLSVLFLEPGLKKHNKDIALTVTKLTAEPEGVNSKWPVEAGYVPGFERLFEDGLSTVTLDNSHNDSAIFVKLALESQQIQPIRHVYIPEHGSFTIENIRPGSYQLQIEQLADETLYRSDTFSVKQTIMDNKETFSTVKIVLRAPEDANLSLHMVDAQ